MSLNILKRSITPINPNKIQQPYKEPARKIFGRDLKNIVTTYHNKLNESERNSTSNLNLEQVQNKKNKISIRNNSQKVIKREQSKPTIRNDTRAKEKYLNDDHVKNQRSLGQSTNASPKSSSIKDYLLSRAPKAISEISEELPIISLQMRQLVVAWIMQIIHKIPLKPETLFHCILMFDWMLSNYHSSNLSGMVICIQNLQLLALSCLFISTKYEQIYPPSVQVMVKLADYAYSKKKIIEMEASILLQKDFYLTFPTRFIFLEQILNEDQQISASKSKRLEHLSCFLLEMTLMDLWQDATEEQLAQAAFFLAKKVSNMNSGSPKRKTYQLSWKLMQIWKQNRDSTLCYIFDSDKYSFVGGIYLEEL